LPAAGLAQKRLTGVRCQKDKAATGEAAQPRGWRRTGSAGRSPALPLGGRKGTPSAIPAPGVSSLDQELEELMGKLACNFCGKVKSRIWFCRKCRLHFCGDCERRRDK
jgi:hypothetical protein